jgi:hypothetical protein
MNPYYEVIYPKVDKNKLIELAHMIKGIPLPAKGASSITWKPVLRLRHLSSYPKSYNVYGNDTDSWRRTLSASSSGLSPIQNQSPGLIAARRRQAENRVKALRELGKMIRGF